MDRTTTANEMGKMEVIASFICHQILEGLNNGLKFGLITHSPIWEMWVILNIKCKNLEWNSVDNLGFDILNTRSYVLDSCVTSILQTLNLKSFKCVLIKDFMFNLLEKSVMRIHPRKFYTSQRVFLVCNFNVDCN